MATKLGPLYHTLIKTPPLSRMSKYGRLLRDIKKLAKRNSIPSMVSKTGIGGSGLVYAESRDEMEVRRFEQEVRGMTNAQQRFATIVPTMKAPVPEDRPTRAPGERFVDVDGMANFGTEMARRSLWDWWADIVKKGYFKD
ncbi:hypothetical protein diail_4952 [Diaporthe ilicicola]|nr:hypothetical protein diail_4952 [Diaporthe ilicicola]